MIVASINVITFTTWLSLVGEVYRSIWGDAHVGESPTCSRDELKVYYQGSYVTLLILILPGTPQRWQPDYASVVQFRER